MARVVAPRGHPASHPATRTRPAGEAVSKATVLDICRIRGMDGLRLTAPLLKLLEVLLADPSDDFWGFELMKTTGLASGTIYPLLARLEGLGWLESGWDDQLDSGPRRRYYRLTRDGAVSARQAVAEARSKARAGSARWDSWSRPALGGGRA
jgi:PadR family transcriptional regulator PadR